MSRTDQVITPSASARATSGPIDTRPREGLRPTTPHHPAGRRMEPETSLPWAMGTIRAATAAAAPPLDPLTERVRSHGLRVGPNAPGWVVGWEASSGALLVPSVTRPAARSRAPTGVSSGQRKPRSRSMALPMKCGTPAWHAPASFRRKGTPANGPATGAAAAAAASSKSGATTAPTCASSASTRATAASTSSSALACPSRTRAACAVASSRARSCSTARGYPRAPCLAARVGDGGSSKPSGRRSRPPQLRAAPAASRLRPRMRLAVCQASGTPGDVAANLRAVRRSALEAAAAGAELVVFPEAFLTGYNIGARLAELAEPADGPSLTALRAIAAEAGIAMLCGYPERAGTDGLQRRRPRRAWRASRCSATARRTSSAPVDRAAFAPGDGFPLAQRRRRQGGLLICYDIEFPEARPPPRPGRGRAHRRARPP